MNCNPKHNNSLRRQAAKGFTLIEMIGVLAVIAILAALLIPKVFSAINSARVNGVCVNTETVKTAIVGSLRPIWQLQPVVFGTNGVNVR